MPFEPRTMTIMGKWHHAAMIYKNGQMKAYLDNTRALRRSAGWVRSRQP